MKFHIESSGKGFEQKRNLSWKCTMIWKLDRLQQKKWEVYKFERKTINSQLFWYWRNILIFKSQLFQKICLYLYLHGNVCFFFSLNQCWDCHQQILHDNSFFLNSRFLRANSQCQKFLKMLEFISIRLKLGKTQPFLN